MFFLKTLPSRQMIEGYVAKTREGDSDTIEQALSLLRNASLLIRQLNTYFRNNDFSQLRFLVLVVIDREPERNSLLASELAERLDVSRPVLSRTLKGLIADGLISAKADDRDGRAKQVSLTGSGKQKLSDLMPGYFRQICFFMNEQETEVFQQGQY